MKSSGCTFCIGLLGLIVAVAACEAQPSKKSTHTPGKKVLSPAPTPVIKTSKSTSTPKKSASGKQHAAKVQSASANWKMNAGQSAALDKLLAQQPLTDGERQQLSNLLFSGKDAGLTREDETSLSFLLADEAAHPESTTATSVTASSPSSEIKPAPLFLRVFNQTGEPLKVWVQVLPSADEKKNGKKPLPKTMRYELATGKAYNLLHQGERVQASAIRVWAMSPTRTWGEHRDHELQLTSPSNQSKTYTLTFSK